MADAVDIAADVLLVCMTHALSAEKEEVMGLLIGDVVPAISLVAGTSFVKGGGGGNGEGGGDEEGNVVRVSHTLALRRSDRRKDRVEISPEQLSEASSHAERMSAVAGRPLRVVGWYHSHPHITVWPSHVDLRTQHM